MPEIWGSVRLKESIFFTDSDDTPVPGYPGNFISKAKVSGADLRCAVLHIWWNRRKNVWITFRKKLSAVEEKNIWRSGFYRTSGGNFSIRHGIKLIRRELLLENDIRFGEEFAICEDMAFSMQVLEKSKGICVVPSRCIVITIRKRRIW